MAIDPSDRRAQRRPRIHVASLGCAKNLVDSERLLGRLAGAGAIVGAPVEKADILIVNTCGFIEAARAESLAVIREYAERASGGGTRLFVVGCLVQRDREVLAAQLPDVDGFFGLDEDEAIADACGLGRGPAEDARLILTPRHLAYLRISEGCDNRCTYCTIPSIRGPFRSRPISEVVQEAEQLVEGGAREIDLIGQDTTRYGVDLSPTTRIGIEELLSQLAEVPGLRWIRLLYTHPAHFRDALIEAYATIPSLCPYVDLPLQHLDDEILRRMGRGVTQSDCLGLIERLRARIPDVAIRTTFIVGFPGETEAQFRRLLDLVREVRFEHVGAFAYSREAGTPAAQMPDPVPPKTIERRLDALMGVQQEIVFERNESRIGEMLEVLIDEPAGEADVWVARSSREAPDVDSVIYVRGSGLRSGEFRTVEVVGFDGYDLVAEPVGGNR